jgi:hypothetical protein
MRRQHRPSGRRYSIAIAVVMALSCAALLRPVAAQDNRSLTIPLNEHENSGVSGTAILTAEGENTRVSMELSGDPLTGDHPTHIHTGTCRNFDPNPLYPLTTVVLDEVNDEGVSETTVENVRLRDLLASDYVILVHPSAEELFPELVCGDIKPDGGTGGSRDDAAAIVEATPGADQASTSVTGTPRAGVGSAHIGLSWTKLFGLLAVLFATASATLVVKRGVHG